MRTVHAHTQLDERITRMSEASKLLIRAVNAAIRFERPGGPRFASRRSHKEAVMRYVALVGRILFSAIFIIAGFGHFTQAEIGYAAQQGVPFASLLVPASGVMAVAGGLSILVGYYARVGAVLVAVFLVPVTLALHRFWAEADPMMAQLQLAMFLKNVSMLGGALIVSHFGAGPASIDASRHRPTAGARRPHAA